MALTNPLQPFLWGAGGAKMTPEEIARERKIAEALGVVDTSPVDHWTQGAARMANALVGRIKEGRADKAEAANAEGSQSRIAALLGGMNGGGAAQFPAAPGGAGQPFTTGEGSAGSTLGVGGPAPDMSGNQIYSEFMDGVKGAGITNPNALAAIAATGKAESGFSPGNVYRTWSDPSESGEAGAAGGIMSWRGPRLKAMQQFAAANGGDPSRPSPALQAQFLAQEDPGLIVALNNAKSPAEAQQLMNNAWKFAGYNRPGGEAARRIASANSFASNFADSPNPAAAANEAMATGQPVPSAPVQVASTDPSIGMVTPATHPQDGGFQVGGPASTSDAGNRVIQALINPQSMTGGAPMPMQGMPQSAQAAPPLPAPQTVQDMPVAAAPQVTQTAPQDLSRIPPMAGGTAGTASAGASSSGFNPGTQAAIAQALSSPYASDSERRVATILLQQQMEQQQQASDPLRALDIQTKQAQFDQIRRGVPNANSSFGNLDAQARAAGLTPGTPEYRHFMLNGGGDPATFRALDLQAKAAGFLPNTPEYNEFMATRGAGLQAGAAQTAKNQADIATGGAAAGSVDLGKASIKAGTDAWESYGKIQANLGNINEAINAIDSGAKSGVVYKMLPNVTEASASLSNAMSRMGLDVVGSVTFGALSEGELNLAMNTAVPQDLGPAELKNWLIRKRDAQTKAGAMLADAAQYLTVPGNTINGWIEKNRAAKAAAPPGNGWKDAGGGVKIREKQ